MRVERNSVAGLWDPSLGYLVRLTGRERATLARAAVILHGLRERLGDDDSDVATDVALAAYTCEDVAGDPLRVDSV